MGRIASLIGYTFCIAWACVEIYLLITAIVADSVIGVLIDTIGACLMICCSFLWGRSLLKE